MEETARLKRELRRMKQSRHRWKQRVAAKHAEIRHLRVNVRDLSRSRELWKQRCLQKQPAPTADALPTLLPGPFLAESPCRGEL